MHLSLLFFDFLIPLLNQAYLSENIQSFTIKSCLHALNIFGIAEVSSNAKAREQDWFGGGEWGINFCNPIH